MPEMVPISGVSVGMPEALEQTIPLNEEQQARLAEWQREIARAGVKGTLHEPTGAVLDEILKLADTVNADLVVMGTHGHGAMYNLLVRSVTEGVLKQGACPVLLVPSSGEAKP